jgi:Asp-tRNA(Asn)/Glu-tRNA(Gln) amidotransferase A subunit family amidase
MSSVRVPASMNALVGIRHTFGLISSSGVMPLNAEWDTVAPLARCVEDPAILLMAMPGSGHDTPTGAVRSGTSQPLGTGPFITAAGSPRLNPRVRGRLLSHQARH